MKNKTKQLLMGKESWPIEGDLLTPEQLAEIMTRCKGLPRRWGCAEKAVRTADVVGGRISVALGHLTITNTKGDGQFEFQWNPPYEFHAWVETPNGIIDIALAGAIEKGLSLRDKQGPYLLGRRPIILAGHPPPWTDYRRHAFLDKSNWFNFR